MKLWIKLLFVLFVFCFLFHPLKVEAQSGCCSWHGGVCSCDSSIGRKVCCDGTYSPSCGCIYIPTKPVTPEFPDMNASWESNPNTDKTFNLSVTLNDSSPTQYSAVINKCKGCNPGPLTDFYSNKFNFNNLKTGRYYLNVKKAINGTWSTVAYWTIDIPQWSAPTPTPFPTIVPLVTNQNNPPSSNDSFITFITVIILLGLAIGSIYVGYRLIKWFLKYAKEHDWVYTVLIWTIIIGGIMIFSLASDSSKKTTTTTQKTYTCNCSKTCPNMTCSEAYYQLNECGCSKRDGDGDGIPCEEQCR